MHCNKQRLTCDSLGEQLCGRLGQALKSDTYVDFPAGQPARGNIVEVSG